MPRIAKYKETLLNEFETKQTSWTYSDFEKRMTEIRKGTYYQDAAKTIIIEAHKIGRWPKTVKNYLVTNYESFGNTSPELISTFNSIIELMSETEKKELGL